MPKSAITREAILKKIKEEGIESLTSEELQYFAAMDDEKKPVVKKTKITAASFKKGTSQESVEERLTRLERNRKDVAAADEYKKTDEYKESATATDKEGDYLSAEERKARFKKTKITGEDIKRTGAIGSAEKTVKADTTGVSALAIRKPSVSEGVTPDDVTPTDAEAEKGGALAQPTESLIGSLKTIDNSVNSIVETLKQGNKTDTKAQTDARKQAEKDARAQKEGKLEGIKDKLATAAQTVLKPVQNIFQKIWDFLKIVLLGRVVMKLFEWFTNPENSKKVASLFRFLKDWWPVLVAGIMAIVGPGIIFTAGLIALLAWGIPKIINIVKTLFGFGPKVDKELKNVEDDADALGKDSKKEVEAQGLEPKEDKAEVGDNEPPATDVTPTEVGASEQQAKDVQSGAEQTGDLPEGGQGFAQGGEVPGTGSGDTVPAMLTPGEFVMSKGAVQQYGVDTLAGMNAAAGGTNRPTVGRYSGGGMALDVPSFTYPKSTVSPKSTSNTTANFSGGGSVSPNLKKLVTVNFAGGGLVPAGYEKSPEEAAAEVSADGEKKSVDKKKVSSSAGKRLLNFLKPFGMIPFVGKKIVSMGSELVGGVEELIVGFHEEMHSGGSQAAQVAKSSPSIAPVKPPPTRKGAGGGDDPVAKANTKISATGAPSQELPEFSASKMRSGSKIKTLGIVV